jgi:DNA-binding response OmpR family regulator
MKTILVVDADPAAAASLVARLETAGFEAQAAIDASAACDAAHAKYFQTAVVVFASLFDEQWRHWLPKLRRAAPHTWILVVVDGSTDQMTSQAHGLGADGVLQAPVDVRVLSDRLLALSVRSRPTF